MANWFLAILFVAGLTLTGSDGAWFPVGNLVGLGAFALFAYIAKKGVIIS